MESNVEVALAAKLLRLFPPDDDTFLTFPLSGAAFSAADLDIFPDDSDTAEQLREQGHRQAQFARILNQIPSDSLRYESYDRLLWDEYARILDRAQMAASVLTAGERRRLTAAKAYLSDQTTVAGVRTTVYSAALKDYYRYKEAYEEIERALIDERITAEASSDPAAKGQWKRRRAKLNRLRDQAMQDWLTLGHKDRVESAQATVASLSGKNPEVQRQELHQEMDACRTADLASGTDVYGTFYSPSDSFSPKVAWQQMHLTRDEITSLLTEAPQALQNWKTAAAEAIESVTVEYACVVVMRPWFDPAFFDSRCWRLPAGDQAPVCDGESPREGRIPAFITNMLVARKVTVERRGDTATGSQTGSQTGSDIVKLTGLNFMQRYVHTLGADIETTTRSNTVQRLHLAAAVRPLLAHRAAATPAQPTPPPATPARRPLAMLADRSISARMRGLTIERPDIDIPPPPPRRAPDRPPPLPPRPEPHLPRPPAPTHDEPPPPTPDQPPELTTEEVVLDGVVVLAYRCRRLPQSPDPDSGLDWDRKPHRRDRKHGAHHDGKQDDHGDHGDHGDQVDQGKEGDPGDHEGTHTPQTRDTGPHEVTVPDFPLPRGHWFGIAAGKPRGHSGHHHPADQPAITMLQQRLCDLGRIIDVDGYFGPQTAKAVRAVQRQLGLRATGRVNQRTWQALWQPAPAAGG